MKVLKLNLINPTVRKIPWNYINIILILLIISGYFGEIGDDLEVQKILRTIFDGNDFRRYDKVRLSYKELEIVLNCGKRDLIAALENQKAVYLITDKENGKMYVGSATSYYGMLYNDGEVT